MSDFLSRLAERALGATPPLQPLLGSRFAAPVAEPADGFVEETVEGESSASPAPAVRRSEASPPPPPRPLSAAPADVRDADPAPSTLLVPTPPPPEAPAAAASSSPHPPIESAAPVAGDAPSSRSAPRAESIPPSPGAVSDQGAAGEHRERRERREDQALLIPIVPRSDPPVPSPSAAGVEDGDARPSDSDGGRRVEAAPRGMTEVVIRTAQDERDPFGEEDDSGALLMPVSRDRQTVVIGGDAIDGDADGAEPRHSRAPERVPAAGMEKGGAERPVVQVTIGRIEVRAVHPPAPPQPAREAGWTPPVLSLDDYLKRGSGR